MNEANEDKGGENRKENNELYEEIAESYKFNANLSYPKCPRLISPF